MQDGGTMKKTLGRIALPASLVVGSLGVGLGGADAASQTAPSAVVSVGTPVTLRGTVVKAQDSKMVFWFSHGTKIYKVRYSLRSFVEGSSSNLTRGVPVSVTGTFVGHSTTIVRASGVAVLKDYST